MAILTGEATLSGTGELGGVPTIVTEMGIESVFDSVEVAFATTEGEELTISNGEVETECDCETVQFLVRLRHNLIEVNFLKPFLEHSGLVMPDEFNLQYLSTSNAWQRHFHFDGLGVNHLSEQWNILFEWTCTDRTGSVEIGTSSWHLCIFLRRESGGDVTFTRLFYVFPGDIACVTNNFLEVDFSIDIDTELGVVPIEDSFVDIRTFHDGIGLFRNNFWLENPLRITLSELRIQQPDPVQDIRPIIPVEPVLEVPVIEEVPESSPRSSKPKKTRIFRIPKRIRP